MPKAYDFCGLELFEPQGIDLRAHSLVHPHQLGPAAMVTFGRKFPGRIESHVRTDIWNTGRMIQTIRRILNECCITLRIRIGAESEQYFARVVHIAVGIHDDDVLGKHHLPHAP